MSAEIIRNLADKDLSAVDKQLLLDVLREDLARYEQLLNSKKELPVEDLVELFDLSNVNSAQIIHELQKFHNKKLYTNVAAEDVSDEALLADLLTELTQYYDQLVSLQARMSAKLDSLLQERNVLFTKCQLLMDLLE